MLGILLIYFIGKRFYDLSTEHNQNKWLYAILSVVIYYAGTFIGGLFLGIFIELGIVNISLENNFVIGLIAIPFALGLVYLFYIYLEKKWKKSALLIKDEIKDIGKNIEENN